jgi:hypothetical protein
MGWSKVPLITHWVTRLVTLAAIDRESYSDQHTEQLFWCYGRSCTRSGSDAKEGMAASIMT